MKKLIIKFLCVTMCFVSIFSFASCNEDNSTSSSSSSSLVVEESPIADLRIAIKKNPSAYNDKQVTLKGTIIKRDSETILYDYHVKKGYSDLFSEVQYRADVMKKPSIEVRLSDNIQSYFVESCDYVEITGIVKISDNEIYLEDCQCTVIMAHEEMR